MYIFYQHHPRGRESSCRCDTSMAFGRLSGIQSRKQKYIKIMSMARQKLKRKLKSSAHRAHQPHPTLSLKAIITRHISGRFNASRPCPHFTSPGKNFQDSPRPFLGACPKLQCRALDCLERFVASRSSSKLQSL